MEFLFTEYDLRFSGEDQVRWAALILKLGGGADLPAFASGVRTILDWLFVHATPSVAADVDCRAWFDDAFLDQYRKTHLWRRGDPVEMCAELSSDTPHGAFAFAPTWCVACIEEARVALLGCGAGQNAFSPSILSGLVTVLTGGEWQTAGLSPLGKLVANVQYVLYEVCYAILAACRRSVVDWTDGASVYAAAMRFKDAAVPATADAALLFDPLRRTIGRCGGRPVDALLARSAHAGKLPVIHALGSGPYGPALAGPAHLVIILIGTSEPVIIDCTAWDVVIATKQIPITNVTLVGCRSLFDLDAVRPLRRP